MTEIQVLELQLENNGLKIEVLTLRQQLAQAVMPAVQKEREDLVAQHKALAEAAQKPGVMSLVKAE
jgi:regulator of replication initiation timing